MTDLSNEELKRVSKFSKEIKKLKNPMYLEYVDVDKLFRLSEGLDFLWERYREDIDYLCDMATLSALQRDCLFNEKQLKVLERLADKLELLEWLGKIDEEYI